MYVSSQSLYRNTLRTLTNIRLPPRHGRLGRLAFDGVLQAFRLCYAVYYRIKGSRKTKARVGKIISLEHKFVFFMIPKVATSSFRRWQAQFEAIRTRSPLSKVVTDQAERERYYRFAFVRNPWSRVVSCYNDKICNVNKINKITIMARYPGLTPNMSFPDFVDWLCSEEGQDAYADPHWRSQHDLLADESGKVRLDFVGRLENLQGDMDEVCERISIPKFKIPHRNRARNGQETGEAGENGESGREPRHYRDYYTNETRDLVAERYKKDLETFGYRF